MNNWAKDLIDCMAIAAIIMAVIWSICYMSIDHEPKPEYIRSRTIEKCEYIQLHNGGDWIHKGNCPNH